MRYLSFFEQRGRIAFKNLGFVLKMIKKNYQKRNSLGINRKAICINEKVSKKILN